MGSDKKMTIAYWNIRGLAAVMRMILTYGNVEYEEKVYADDHEWFGVDKPKLKGRNPLANLPYVVDGDRLITQALRVFIYLGEKAGVYKGLDDLELLVEVHDLRDRHMGLVYPILGVTRTEAEYKERAAKMLDEDVPAAFGKFEACLKHTYLLGDTPGCADFHLFEMIDIHIKLAKAHGKPNPVANFPKLDALHAAMKNEPNLLTYFASDAYNLFTINSPDHAAWFY